MKTIVTGKRLAGLLGLSLAALSLASCGDETAPPGATISAPGDSTIEYLGPTAAFCDQTAGPLVFAVLDQNGNPLPGVTVRFFGGSQTIALAQRGIDSAACVTTPLNSTDATFFETTTDERGLSPVDIYPSWLVPGCPAVVPPATPEDIDVTASVMASVGTATVVWKADITVKCT